MVIYLCFESIAYGAFHLRVKDLKFALYQGSRFLISNGSSYTGNQGRLATAFSWRMDKRNVQTPLICKLATVFTLSMFQGAFVNIDLEKWADCLHRRAARTNQKAAKSECIDCQREATFLPIDSGVRGIVKWSLMKWVVVVFCDWLQYFSLPSTMHIFCIGRRLRHKTTRSQQELG